MYRMNGVNAHSGRTARTMHPQGPSDADSPVSTDNAGAETEAYERRRSMKGRSMASGPGCNGPLLATLRLANNQRGHHVQ
jgi:hypothetical protein